MNACIDNAIAWAKASDWSKAKESIDMAEDFAKQADNTLPPSAYERAMNACADEAIASAEEGKWSRAKDGLATVKYFAKKAGQALPERTRGLAAKLRLYAV